MSFHFDVVVDVDPGELPFGILVPMLRQRLQRRSIQGLEQRAAAAFHLLEGAGVESLQQRGDGGIQLRQAEEGAISQGGQDPPLHNQDPRLHLGLSLGLHTRAGRMTVP